MPDREKVIKGITHHKLGQCDMSGKICPYWEEEADCTKKMLGDALDLLKEQEAAEPKKESDDYPGAWWYVCGNCGEVIDWHDMYCRHCGREVKWE